MCVCIYKNNLWWWRMYALYLMFMMNCLMLIFRSVYQVWKACLWTRMGMCTDLIMYKPTDANVNPMSFPECLSALCHSVRRVVHLLLLWWRLSGRLVAWLQQFKLDQQREVVGRNVRMRTANNFVFLQPFRVDRAEQTKGVQQWTWIKNVINHTFEIKPERK